MEGEGSTTAAASAPGEATTTTTTTTTAAADDATPFTPTAPATATAPGATTTTTTTTTTEQQPDPQDDRERLTRSMGELVFFRPPGFDQHRPAVVTSGIGQTQLNLHVFHDVHDPELRCNRFEAIPHDPDGNAGTWMGHEEMRALLEKEAAALKQSGGVA